VGLVFFAVKEIASFEERRPAQRYPSQPRGNLQHTPPQFPSIPQHPPPPSFTFRRLNDSVTDILRDAAREADMRRGVSSPPSYRQPGNEPLNGKNILENWRKSVLGLIRLAESNLQLAKSQAAVMNYKGAVEAAATSIENVSRALLHCYGEKPDLNSGQEEPLRLLARRLQGEERAQFEKAIDEAVQLYRNKIVEAYLSEKSIQAGLLNEARTQQIVEIAMKIVAQFRRIMDEHFGTEIAELSEKCTKCGALNIGVWAFDTRGATYQCNICGYKWIQPDSR
jgi:DNA-directed RNA polymerase subunit M/transcription elongation factor TFIIS